jgi:hypothetical protein
MKLLILVILCNFANAGFSELSENDRFSYVKQGVTVKRPSRNHLSIQKRKTADINFKKLADEILEKDKEIEALLKKSQKTLILKSSKNKVLALSRIKGTLLNSVIAMNVMPSKFIVKIIDEHEDLSGGELKCFGHSFQKRVISKCNLLVLNGEEYEVSIELWDLDGAEGIISDYFYSGEEKAFVTSSFASFLQGVLETSKERISSPYGQISDNSSRNMMLGGLSQIAANANKKIASSGESELSISFINSGKEVIIFFDQTLNLNKDSKK